MGKYTIAKTIREIVENEKHEKISERDRERSETIHSWEMTVHFHYVIEIQIIVGMSLFSLFSPFLFLNNNTMCVRMYEYESLILLFQFFFSIPLSSPSDSLSACNLNCFCDFVKYSPICGENGNTYISGCHAGCKDRITNNGSTVSARCRIGNTILEATSTSGCAFKFKYIFIYLFILLFFFASIHPANRFIQIVHAFKHSKTVGILTLIT